MRSGSFFGANLAVTGRVERIEDRVHLTLALVDTETLRELRFSEIEGTQDNLSALQEDVVDTMTGLLELDLAPKIRRVLSAGGTTRPGAYDYYLRGRGYLQRYEQIDQIDDAFTNSTKKEAPRSAGVFGTASSIKELIVTYERRMKSCLPYQLNN